MNTLALVEAIEKKLYAEGNTVAAARYPHLLMDVAKKVGLPIEEIFHALHSDRGLVIYEP